MNMRIARILILLALLTASFSCGDDNKVTAPDISSAYDYADNSYVADPDWLADNLDQPDLLILDARGEEPYATGHIPGAIPVAWQQFADMSEFGAPGFGVLGSVEQISEQLAAIGVDQAKTIIVYANNQEGWGEDGRIVWMLRMAGIDDALMLDGGITHWTAQGHPVTQIPASPTASTFSVAALDLGFTATTDYIASNLSSIKLLDSRSQAEYNGAQNFDEARGGHLPGAVHLNYNQVFQASERLKNQAELDALFSGLGLSRTDEIVVYCTAGIRSAHLSLVLRLAGYTRARNYDASFYEWALDESLPLE